MRDPRISASDSKIVKNRPNFAFSRSFLDPTFSDYHEVGFFWKFETMFKVPIVYFDFERFQISFQGKTVPPFLPKLRENHLNTNIL